MSDNLLGNQPEETPETAYADKWFQRLLTYAGLPAGILSVIFSQTYLAIACFLWLAAAIGYSFVKKQRADKSSVLELQTTGVFFNPKTNLLFGEKEKQETPQLVVEQKQEATLAERPNLIATLVIDSATTRKVDFHIEVENLGKIEAKNIRCEFSSNGFIDLEARSSMPRTLAYGSKLSLLTQQEVIKPKSTTSLVVKIFYSADYDGCQKNFLQQVRFLVRPVDIKVQTIHPEAREDNEVDSNILDQQISQALSFFDLPIGTIGLVIPKIGTTGKSNIIHLANELKSFTFDSIAGIVSFRVKTTSKKFVCLDLPLQKNNKGIHIVLISWDNKKGGILALDGVEKADMEN